MNLDQVNPTKVVAFLEKRYNALEKELQSLLDQFYNAVEADSDERATVLLTQLTQKRTEFYDVAQEYIAGKAYLEAIEKIAEEIKDLPKN